MKIERKSKFYIFLIETLSVILFFALASIVCTNFFVKSSAYAMESVMKNEAMIIAQNVAEEMRMFNGVMAGYTQKNNSMYEKSMDRYTVVVQNEALELDYHNHLIQVKVENKILVELVVVSGGSQ